MYLLIFSLESLRGFIHNLSPVKRSKKTDWFEFHLQTSPSKVQRVVGFIFVACQACKKKITESAHQKYIKCRNCGVRQRQSECKRDASVQVKVEIAGKEIWLTAFTKEIESLLALSPEVSLMSDSKSTEDQLMDLTDIHFTYNVNKKTITQVTSVSNRLAQ